MELDDISMAYSGVGINLVNEERGTLSSYVVRGDQAPRKLLRQLDNQELLFRWQKGEVWERQPDDVGLEHLDRTWGEDNPYHPSVIVDVPFEHGTLATGLESSVGDNATLIRVLREMAESVSLGFERASHRAEQRRAERASLDQMRSSNDLPTSPLMICRNPCAWYPVSCSCCPVVTRASSMKMPTSSSPTRWTALHGCGD